MNGALEMTGPDNDSGLTRGKLSKLWEQNYKLFMNMAWEYLWFQWNHITKMLDTWLQEVDSELVNHQVQSL